VLDYASGLGFGGAQNDDQLQPARRELGVGAVQVIQTW
jgi:hypothetical protein